MSLHRFSRALLSGAGERCARLDFLVTTMSSSTLDSYAHLLRLAAHELNSPASVIIGYLRMVLRDPSESLTPRQRHMLEEVEKSCGRMVAVIREMSLTARLDEGEVKLVHKPLELDQLLREVAEHVHEARDRDVHLALAGDLGTARMLGDADRLRTAFDAVFRAILREKAGPANVVVDARREQIDGRPCAIVVVADAASVQESYERLRQPFDEHKRGGLGLALPIARRVIEGHGGSIWSPAPLSTDEDAEDRDPITRGSAIIALPLTE